MMPLHPEKRNTSRRHADDRSLHRPRPDPRHLRPSAIRSKAATAPGACAYYKPFVSWIWAGAVFMALRRPLPPATGATDSNPISRAGKLAAQGAAS